MRAKIETYPETFDNVARIKEEVTHQEVLPGDDQLWILGSPLVAVIDDIEIVEVPTGFTTDGASVPRLAEILTGWHKWDLPQRHPAIVHDWLYCQVGWRKSRADCVFRALLHAEGANVWQQNAMYWAVTVGGWAAYHADQEDGPAIFTGSGGVGRG